VAGLRPRHECARVVGTARDDERHDDEERTHLLTLPARAAKEKRHPARIDLGTTPGEELLRRVAVLRQAADLTSHEPGSMGIRLRAMEPRVVRGVWHQLIG